MKISNYSIKHLILTYTIVLVCTVLNLSEIAYAQGVLGNPLRVTLEKLPQASAGQCSPGEIELFHGTYKQRLEFGDFVNPVFHNIQGQEPLGPGFYASTSLSAAQQMSHSALQAKGIPSNKGGVAAFCLESRMEGEFFPPHLDGNMAGGVTNLPLYHQVMTDSSGDFFASQSHPGLVVFTQRQWPTIHGVRIRYIPNGK
jgi:hypothetical protein